MRNRKVTLGVIVGTRGFFNPELAAEGRRQVLAKLKELDIQVVILPPKATPTTAVETRDDAQKCAQLFGEKRDIIDGVFVTLPNFGDELAVVQTLDTAKLNVPVLVHAFDDDPDKLDLKRRRDSFCGKLSVTANLYQYGIPFTDTTCHTTPVESEVFKNDLRKFAAVCRVVRGLRGARIGAVGTRPAAFQTMRFSEKLLQAAGITVVPVDLSEIMGAANRLKDTAPEVKAAVKEIRNYGRIPAKIAAAAVVREAKLYVALSRWVAENEIVAAGMQCWTSVQQQFGCGSCVSMSMLGEKLIPFACEVDLGGAIGMYALVLAGGNAAALLDWNNNYGTDRDKCINTHCSSYPRSFIGREVEVSSLDVLGAALGESICFGAVKGNVAAGPMTFTRVDTDDTAGCVKAYVGEGEFTDDPHNMSGGIAVCHIPGLQKLLKFMAANGFEHHVAMARSHVGDIIAEAFDKYMGFETLHHKG